MSEKQMFVSAILFLVSTISGMAAYIITLHKSHAKEQKEILVRTTEVMIKITNAMENNNKIIDKIIK